MPERNMFFTYIYINFFFNFKRYSPSTHTREKSILVEIYHLARIFAQVLRWISKRRIYFLNFDWLEKLILQRNISLRRKVGMISTFSSRNISLQRKFGISYNIPKNPISIVKYFIFFKDTKPFSSQYCIYTNIQIIIQIYRHIV